MPTLSIQRSDPFNAEDQSIRIWMNDSYIATLSKEGSSTLEIPAGTHKLQAWMNGTPGRKLSVQLEEGEALSLSLCGKKVPLGGWWDLAVLTLIIVIPGEALSGWGEWIKTAGLIGLLAFQLYQWLRRTRSFLRLEIASQPVVQATA